MVHGVDLEWAGVLLPGRSAMRAGAVDMFVSKAYELMVGKSRADVSAARYQAVTNGVAHRTTGVRAGAPPP